MNGAVRDRSLVFLVVLVASLTASTWRFPQSSDGTAILATARSLLDHGTLAIDERFARDNGYAPSARIGLDGRAYAKYGVGAALWQLPWLALADAATRVSSLSRPHVEALLLSLVNPLLTATTAALVAALALLFGAGRRDAAALGAAYALTTFAWAYAVTDGTEALQACLVCLAAWGLATFERSGRHGALLTASMALALGALVKPTLVSLWPAFGLGVAIALKKRQIGVGSWVTALLMFCIPIGAAGAVWVALNLARFGAPFAAGYNDPVMTNPLQAGLYGFLVSFNKGIPWYAPLAAAAPLGLWGLRRRVPASAAAFAAASIVWIVLNARFYDWGGGWCWGPRYLLPVVPILVGACAPLPGTRFGRVAAGCLAMAGLGVTLLGVVISEEAYRRTTMHLWLVDATGTVRAGHATEAGRLVDYPRPPADTLPGFSSIAAHWWLARVAVSGCDCAPMPLECSCRSGSMEDHPVFASPPWKTRYPEAVPLLPWGVSLLQPRAVEAAYRAWVHDPTATHPPSRVP